MKTPRRVAANQEVHLAAEARVYSTPMILHEPHQLLPCAQGQGQRYVKAEGLEHVAHHLAGQYLTLITKIA